jgi:hypothetical protein
VIRETTNGRISVEESAKRIIMKVKSVLVTLEHSEDKALTKYPRLLQINYWAFSLLKCRITFYAAEMIEEEWNGMKREIKRSVDHTVKGTLPYKCYILL